jgi:lysophospholipase L1-like esterase
MPKPITPAMPARFLVTIVLQGLLGAGAVLLVLLPGLPWPILLPVAAVPACGLAASLLAARRPDARPAARDRKGAWLKGAAWLGTAGYCAGGTWMYEAIDFWDPYYAWITWLVAGSLLAGWASIVASRQRPEWLRGLAWLWTLMGAVLWLGAAHMQNRVAWFHLGLVLLVAVFVWFRLGFRLSAFETQAANTVILFLVLLPIADWLIERSGTGPAPALAERPYSFDVGGRNPLRFAAWWDRYREAWDRMGAALFMEDPEGEFVFRLRPNSEGYLMESRIQINSDGYRGAEIAPDKGDRYRIVALGESTTFGCTLEKEDRPWPELLEDLIRDRLKPPRPVEVINAGVPAYTLVENLKRLDRELGPIEPDLILSYHGYNGFARLRPAVPAGAGPPPPMFPSRPSGLLARIEFRLESHLYERSEPAVPHINPGSIAELLDTEYAGQYRELIHWTGARGLRLALCTFSMAVNRQSPREVIEFYRPGFPGVHWQIAANEGHSMLVRELTRMHPAVWLVETGHNLDGHHEHYIDLVHFTQAGRRQLAENIFAALADRLAAELADP